MKKFLLALCVVVLMLSVAGTVMARGGYNFHGQPPIIIPESPWQPMDPRNESWIIQKGDLSWAMVTQAGDQSKSLIIQETEHGSDTAIVYQQSYCCTTGGCGCGMSWYGWNIPILTEEAYANTSIIEQSGGGGGHHGHHGGGFHDAYVTQIGDGNSSEIEQTGSDTTATVIQIGAFNESKINQSGRDSNDAMITQYGELNKSFLCQDDGINYASVYQNGFGNLSAIYQNSNCRGYNTALVTQLGYMNYSGICQTGSGTHTAMVTQVNNCFNAGVVYCGPNGVVGMYR